MNQYYAYTRVSTARQGEFGVSLEQQREAIDRYAQRTQMRIAQWFEERETAARAGRPVFSRMMRLLRARKARGVLISNFYDTEQPSFRVGCIGAVTPADMARAVTVMGEALGDLGIARRKAA